MSQVPGGFTIHGNMSALEQLAKVKQREVPCPIIKSRALTTALMTIDDLALKTIIASPDLYEQELTKLIYRHTTFPDLEKSLTYSGFIENISYIDRKLLIWGIFASTYNTLGNVNIKCPYCNNEFTDEIKAEELLQADSVTPWDKDQPFNEYIYQFEYVCNLTNLYKIVFDTSLPTVAQHIAIMNLISADKLKENYNKFGGIFSQAEDVTRVLRSIKVYKSENDLEPDHYITMNDIHKIVTSFFPITISDYVLEQYSKEFDKYIPVFKKPYKCSDCGNEFDYIADPEMSLFRQFFRR